MTELEDNRLNFNQPLLTVRRFSSTVVPSEIRDDRRIDRTTATLPPLPRYISDLQSGPVRNPGTVPFIWEQSPGRPKDGGKSFNPTLNARVVPPKPPPGKNPKHPEDGSYVTRRRVNDVGEDVADSGSEIDDDAFLDALETFSRSESQCLSCSVGVLSGVDGLDSRLSGRFCKEPPAREFMMDRFLPAAKEMASEAPATIVRKPPFKKDQPRPTDNVNDGKSTQLNRPKLNVRFVDDRYGLGESSEDDLEESENPSAKICGLLPRFCLSNAAVSTVGIHPVRSTYPLHRFRVKSSYKRRQGETWCRDGGLVNLQKSSGNFPKAEQHADKSEPKANSSYPISERDGKILEATSLYKLMQSREVAKRPDSSLQTKRVYADNSVKETVVAENPATEEPCKAQERHCMNFRQLLASEGSDWESGSKIAILEETVCVDAEKKKNGTSKSSDADASVSSEITHKSALSSSGTSDSAESSPVTASEGVVSEVTVDVFNGSKQPEAETILTDDEKNNPETSSVIDGKIDLEGDGNSKPGDPLVIPGIYTDFPIPPPLPKSPSDSWLSRTLPSMGSKNSGQSPGFAANFLSKVHPPTKPPLIDPKWETIVKNSNVDRAHLRFSEELLAPIPESCGAEH